MSVVATTKMSSKGQVVIPEGVRKKMGLTPGVQFVVVSDHDTVIFKVLSPPSMDQFDSLMEEGKKQARELGIKKSDVAEAIKEARRNKR